MRMLFAAGVLLAFTLGLRAEDAKPSPPKNMAELLCGRWTGKTPKGAFELNFDEKGAFTSGQFFNFPLKSCTVKSASPFAFEAVYAIEKMGGKTVTIQFKDGKLGLDFKTITGTFNTMLDKGEFSMAKGASAPAQGAQPKKK
ncbi:MAG: hypothetical protein KIS92_26650 [Planctomycetota bacterium]|nr:hypothetical protein [Planctomycetota bacterium]